jgi:EmrB/QacA subfamily drug resistance transporter
VAESYAPPLDVVNPEAAELPTFRESLKPGQLIPVLVGLMLGMLLAALDQTVVGTSLPRITAELHGFDQYTWVVTAYLLATTVAVPIYGKLSDIYGRRVFFIGGMVIFLIGSALSGTSQNMTQLIIYRGIQGLGAGALFPIAQAIIGDIFPPSERGKWQGLFVAVFGLATIVGPLLGGYITDNWGWRWVFYVNMPVGALALVTASLTIPKLALKQRHRIDYLGSITLVLWAVPLLLALSLGGQTSGGYAYNWDSQRILGLFGFAAAMLLAFVAIELIVKEPIISPRLFKSSIFSVSVLAMFLVSAGMFGAIVYLPFFVQDVLGQSATNSGVVLTPMMLGFMVSSLIGGQVLSRTGRYKILALTGFVVAAAGMFLLSRMDPNTSNETLYRNMAVAGLGIGVMISLFTIVVQNAFAYQQLGEVTATLTFFRTMGSTIGLAVLGSLTTNLFTTNLRTNMPAALQPYVSPSSLAQNLGNPQGSGGGLPSGLQAIFSQFGAQGAQLAQQLENAIKLSLSQAITTIFLIAAGMMVLAFVVTLFLREIPLRRSHRPQQGTPASATPAPQAAPGAVGATMAGEPAVPTLPMPRASGDWSVSGHPEWATAAATLATLAAEAQRWDADPRLLGALSGAADGRYPHDWTPDQRGRAVAREILAPLAQALLRADD